MENMQQENKNKTTIVGGEANTDFEQDGKRKVASGHHDDNKEPIQKKASQRRNSLRNQLMQTIKIEKLTNKDTLNGNFDSQLNSKTNFGS